MFLRVWLVVVAVAIALLIGRAPLIDADEGRNAEVAREMAESNDYVMPRLNTLPYLDKPVVYFAAQAALMEVLGPTETAARLPAYLFTLATAGVLFWFARRVWGGATPWVASIIFLATPLTIAFARIVIFDSALTFFSIAALSTFYFAVEEKNRRWSVAAWAAMGFAMITKGPVTFVLVLLVVLPFAWKRGGLRTLFPLAGLVAFAAIVAPWVWGVSQVVPEFLRYVLVTETAERMATGALKRTGPPWYFVPYLLAGALPWSVVAAFSWRKFRRPDPATIYWLLALAIPLVFFSINQSKRPQYIVPLMPAIALLVARIWDEAKTRAAAVVFLILSAILLAGPLVLHRFRMRPEMMAVADETAIGFGLVFAAGGLLAFFLRRRELVLVALTFPLVVLPLVADPMMSAVANRRSTREFVAELRPHLTGNTQVIGVEAFTGSLAFYLRRPIILVTSDASELTSNYLLRRYDQFLTMPRTPLRPLAWLDRSLADCCSRRVYVVRLKDEQWRSRLESRGWRAIADGGHFVAYGKAQ
jgi:4-amino-4-deoxy-L-arabinose transferase-like glycosyltransferase